jgi:hypothetical protein
MIRFSHALIMPSPLPAQIEGLYSPNTLAADGEPVEVEGDCLLISSDIYCTEHTAIAARSAAGCCVEVRGLALLLLVVLCLDGGWN